MIRDNEDPAEEQCEISPSSVILHTSLFPGDISHPPPTQCLPLHQHMGSRKAAHLSCIPRPQDSGCT